MLPRTLAVAGLAVALASVHPGTARAEQRVTTPLDEATFLKRVRDRSPRQHVFDDRRAAARAQGGVTSVLPNPTLSYEREDVPSLDTSNDYVRLGWTLDVSGRRGLARSAAREGAAADRLDVDRAEALFESDARLAYLDAVYARAHVAQLDAARATLAELVSALTSRATQGDASSYDADRARLELDSLDDERATARRLLETAQLRLGGLMGEPATPYDPTDPLVLPAVPEAVAKPYRPDVDAALARAKEAQLELRSANRTWIPRLEVVIGMVASKNVGSSGTGYVLGIGGDLPVFDRGGRAADRSRADAKRWRSEADALANEARSDAEQARLDVVLRIDQAKAYLAGPATRAADLERRAVVAYREGDRPILELLDVQRTARHAAGRALELTYEARRAELTLRRALGRDR
jgi:outer membrane protein, heavy metal efflux system